MTTEMKMETRSLASLRPAEYNPRVQLQPADPEYQNIKRSIETFGYVDPIIINQDGTIIGGHQRYNVMKDLGYTEAQVVVVDLDKNNEKALNIALNKITGEWDEIKLKDLLLDLDLNDYDLTATGFSSKEVEDLVIRLDKDVEAEDDDFDADADYESIEEPVTQRGDIWILGDHLVLVDGDKYKDMIAGRMKKPNGRGSWMVFEGCDREYAEQVTAEHKVNVKSGNRTVQRWVPKRSHIDNHYLDAEVYALAAADISGVRTLHLQDEAEAKAKAERPEEAYAPEETWIKQNENWI